MATLYQLSEQMVSIEAMLEENGGELTPELQALWEETTESLQAKVDGYNALIQKLLSQSETVDKEIKRLTAIKKVADNSVKRLKEHIFNAMQSFGVDKLEGQYCRMSIRNNPISMRIDEGEVMKGYETAIEKMAEALPPYIKIEVKVDKSELKAMYKADADSLPAGCEAERTQALIIK